MQSVNRRIGAVFFDAVGTILHPAQPVWETYHKVAKHHGIHLDPSEIGLRLKQSIATREINDARQNWQTSEPAEQQRWRNHVAEALGEHPHVDDCFSELWDWYAQRQAWVLAPHVEIVLNQLARLGLVLGMASNFDNRLNAILQQCPELQPLMAHCIISSQIGWRKPATQFFADLCAKAGLPAYQILYVGDDPRNDYKGASAAGMNALLYNPSRQKEGYQQITDLLQVVDYLN